MINKTILTISLALALGTTTAAASSNIFAAKQASNTAIPHTTPLAREATTYIWPEPHAAQTNFIEQQSRSSNEYWQVVTGAELSQGISVHTTSDALIRVASYADYSSGAKQVSEPLNPDMLQMSAKGEGLLNTPQIISQMQMKHAGFNDGSVALKVNETDEQLTLRTTQNITDDGRYLLHIKEKNSPIELQLAAKSNIAGITDNVMDLDIKLAEQPIADSETKVRLLDPTGQEVPVAYQGSTVTFANDLGFFGARQGLYELEVNVSKKLDGKLVKRTIKFPFANTVKTAQLNGQPKLDMKNGYELAINVFEPGRYGVTATLQGTTATGELIRLQTVSSAAWLEANGSLPLPFTLNEFQGYRNFTLVDIKLMDQSRMMVQQVLASAL